MIAGYCIGFMLKKIVKWALVILGVLGGIIFMAIQWMQQQGYIQGVRWDRLGNDISTTLQTYVSHIDFNNLQHTVFGTLGIPISSGLGIGLLAGFVRTH
jgi:uncharacterized membrane protein (Fun14 family)